MLNNMRLADGTVFPIPITLTVADPSPFKVGQEIALRSAKNNRLAILTIEEIYERDPELEAQKVCGTLDAKHPFVAEMKSWGRYNLSGPVQRTRDSAALRFPGTAPHASASARNVDRDG